MTYSKTNEKFTKVGTTTEGNCKLLPLKQSKTHALDYSDDDHIVEDDNKSFSNGHSHSIERQPQVGAAAESSDSEEDIALEDGEPDTMIKKKGGKKKNKGLNT